MIVSGYWEDEWGVINTDRHHLVGTYSTEERARVKAEEVGGVVKHRRVWTSDWEDAREEEPDA